MAAFKDLSSDNRPECEHNSKDCCDIQFVLHPFILVCQVFWLNETNQMNQINQTNQINLSRVPHAFGVAPGYGACVWVSRCSAERCMV